MNVFSQIHKYYRMVKLQGNSRFMDYNFSIRLFFFSNMQAGRTLCKKKKKSSSPSLRSTNHRRDIRIADQ